MENQEKFTYSYAVPNQDERDQIKRIQEKYQPRSSTQTKLAHIRALDKKITSIPTVFALTLGILGTLVFGTGLTCILEWNYLIIGIISCLLGIVPILLAAPVYHRQHQKLKDRYSDEILKLSKELLEETENRPIS